MRRMVEHLSKCVCVCVCVCAMYSGGCCWCIFINPPTPSSHSSPYHIDDTQQARVSGHVQGTATLKLMWIMEEKGCDIGVWLRYP